MYLLIVVYRICMVELKLTQSSAGSSSSSSDATKVYSEQATEAPVFQAGKKLRSTLSLATYVSTRYYKATLKMYES